MVEKLLPQPKVELHPSTSIQINGLRGLPTIPLAFGVSQGKMKGRLTRELTGQNWAWGWVPPEKARIWAYSWVQHWGLYANGGLSWRNLTRTWWHMLPWLPDWTTVCMLYTRLPSKVLWSVTWSRIWLHPSTSSLALHLLLGLIQNIRVFFF